MIVLPTCEEPRASVIVVTRRNPRLLADCLRSLAGADSSTPHEVILVLNGAVRELAAFVRTQVDGARVIESRVNLGFSGGANRGAAQARGEYLVFLNDDTEVTPGWLDRLVETADENPDAGAVGSRILFPDETVQEAGSVVWSNGTTAPVGRGLPADTLDNRHLRAVDFCSACSLLVRRTTWLTCGGFDPRYFPAYYEDVDLCLAIAHHGETVLYEPRSQVVHHESATADPDLKSLLFRRNVELLRRKWPEALARKEQPAPESRSAVTSAIRRASGNGIRLLIIDDRLPDAGIGSGFGRLQDALAELARPRYAVTFFASDSLDGDQDALRGQGVEILGVDLLAELGRPERVYDVIVISRPYNFRRYYHAIRERQPQAAIVYDAEALFHRRLERQAALTADSRVAHEIEAEAAQLKRVELDAAREADHVVCVSEVEAAVVRSEARPEAVTVMPPRRAGARLTAAPIEERRGIAFLGGWLGDKTNPNVDAVTWFVEEALPLVRARIPWIQLRVGGANPPPEIRRLAGANVRVLGFIDDPYAFYDAARVVVVPMRYGSGVKVKAVEALQYGVPVVATPVGAEGINVEAEEGLMVGESPEELAAHLTSMLEDGALWRATRERLEEVNRRWQAAPGPSWSDTIDNVLRERSQWQRRIRVPRILAS